MIQRRPLTRMIGGGIGTGIIASLTGCTGDEDPNEDEANEFDEETATNYYDKGITDLVETAETLNEWAELW